MSIKKEKAVDLILETYFEYYMKIKELDKKLLKMLIVKL